MACAGELGMMHLGNTGCGQFATSLWTMVYQRRHGQVEFVGFSGGLLNDIRSMFTNHNTDASVS